MTVHPVTFQDRVRGALGGTIGGIGRGLHRMHVHPDAITAVGLLVVVGAAVLIGRGEIQWGAIVLILGLPLDALDGAVARAGNRTGKFGGVLDSTFDRAADALIYGRQNTAGSDRIIYATSNRQSKSGLRAPAVHRPAGAARSTPLRPRPPS